MGLIERDFAGLPLSWPLLATAWPNGSFFLWGAYSPGEVVTGKLGALQKTRQK